MTLRNPLDRRDMIPVWIRPDISELAQDWISALGNLLLENRALEKNFCWHGWPNTPRNLEYLCAEMNRHVARINASDLGYHIACEFTPQSVEDQTQGGPNHLLMNEIHNHFEILQGTVGSLSAYYLRAEPAVKYSIRQLNLLCHEMESLCISLRKARTKPDWVRPSQITTFLGADRYRLNGQHRRGFADNGYDRRFGHVYMHWAQLGKTLIEVYRDEDAPHLDQATCEAITHLEYYSGEFDIEWGRDITYADSPWHRDEIDGFHAWLEREGYDPRDPGLSLGYLHIGEIDLDRSFGTRDPQAVQRIMETHLDIYSLALGSLQSTYDYSWSDPNHEERQIERLMPGYLSHV